jgi:hypothetical protein
MLVNSIIFLPTMLLQVTNDSSLKYRRVSPFTTSMQLVHEVFLRGVREIMTHLKQLTRKTTWMQAHVKLVYLQADGTELSFTRGITLQSVSEYRINDKTVTWEEYNNKMRSLGILVKARNFLVFQVRTLLQSNIFCPPVDPLHDRTFLRDCALGFCKSRARN